MLSFVHFARLLCYFSFSSLASCSSLCLSHAVDLILSLSLSVLVSSFKYALRFPLNAIVCLCLCGTARVFNACLVDSFRIAISLKRTIQCVVWSQSKGIKKIIQSKSISQCE